MSLRKLTLEKYRYFAFPEICYYEYLMYFFFRFPHISVVAVFQVQWLILIDHSLRNLLRKSENKYSCRGCPFDGPIPHLIYIGRKNQRTSPWASFSEFTTTGSILSFSVPFLLHHPTVVSIHSLLSFQWWNVKRVEREGEKEGDKELIQRCEGSFRRGENVPGMSIEEGEKSSVSLVGVIHRPSTSTSSSFLRRMLKILDRRSQKGNFLSSIHGIRSLKWGEGGGEGWRVEHSGTLSSFNSVMSSPSVENKDGLVPTLIIPHSFTRVVEMANRKNGTFVVLNSFVDAQVSTMISTLSHSSQWCRSHLLSHFKRQ